MQNKPPESPNSKWQWDVVTWAVILLVVVTIILFAMLLWPHGFDPRER